MEKAADMNTIKATHERLVKDGMNVTENALRQWVKSGVIPSVASGRCHFVYYPNVIRFLRGGETA